MSPFFIFGLQYCNLDASLDSIWWSFVSYSGLFFRWMDSLVLYVNLWKPRKRLLSQISVVSSGVLEYLPIGLCLNNCTASNVTVCSSLKVIACSLLLVLNTRFYRLDQVTSYTIEPRTIWWRNPPPRIE